MHTAWSNKILRKISKIGDTRTSDFEAKMHQIRFPLGLEWKLWWRLDDKNEGEFCIGFDKKVLFTVCVRSNHVRKIIPKPRWDSLLVKKGKEAYSC